MVGRCSPPAVEKWLAPQLVGQLANGWPWLARLEGQKGGWLAPQLAEPFSTYQLVGTVGSYKINGLRTFLLIRVRYW
jgi:hypothetical protein